MANVVDWVKMHRKGKILKDIVFQAILCRSILHHLLGERNSIIFKHKGTDVQQVNAKTETDIRACTSSWRNVKRFHEKRVLSVDWQISSKIFAIART